MGVGSVEIASLAIIAARLMSITALVLLFATSQRLTGLRPKAKNTPPGSAGTCSSAARCCPSRRTVAV